MHLGEENSVEAKLQGKEKRHCFELPTFKEGRKTKNGAFK